MYFVQITDTHLGSRENNRRLAGVIDRINNLPMDVRCVVHTGDVMDENITDAETVREARALFSRLSVPVHFVAGNHDILRGNYEATRELFEMCFGPLYSQADYDAFTFLFYYSEPLALGAEGVDEAFRTLQTQLDSAAGRPILLFHHTPSVETLYHLRFDGGWPAEVAAKWCEMLNAYDVTAIFAGHYSTDEHHWIGEIPLFVAPSVEPFHGRQGSFRVYEVADGKIGYRTVYLERKKTMAKRAAIRANKVLESWR